MRLQDFEVLRTDRIVYTRQGTRTASMPTDRPKQGEKKTEPNGNRRDRSPKKIRIELFDC